MLRYDVFINGAMVRQNITWIEVCLFGNDTEDPYSTTGKPFKCTTTDILTIFLAGTTQRVGTNGQPIEF